MQIYTVTYNDTVDSIAAAFGISPDSIIYNNQLAYPYPLAIGQALLLSTEEPSSANRTIRSNGYAYPFISPWVLNQTLPFLSELSVFSYGFTTEGFLIPPPLDDSFMILQAQAFHTKPILTLTPFGPDGMFNNRLISSLIHNPNAVEQLMEQLLEIFEEKEFTGVDVDFEYIMAEDRDAFSDFVGTLAQRLNPLGYTVSVALAPKVADDQPGLLYEGKDYAALGAYANYVLLMTYEWGYTYGPPMAVAPMPQVQRVVDYAISRIPAEKIRLGIANYGYDWPLPFQQGVTKAITIGNIEAVQIAIRHGAAIQMDPVSLSPFFRYWKEGIQHEVWFEDVRSLNYKYSLVQDYGLQGIGIWQIMRLFRPGLLLLADRFWIN